MQKTFLIIKPDAVARGLCGQIISRLEQKGLTLVAAKMILLTDEILDKHYAHLADKPFFGGIKEFMKKTPVIVSVWEGVDAVNVVRNLCGVTNAREAAPGTIRGDFANSIQANVVHASDLQETAEKEVAMYFSREEIFDYAHCKKKTLYSKDELAQ
ncbi:MAG: nucleoside-diphosphate kinase [Candidatus Micrarchaeia archaeon]